ncbi:MAG: hypothetical protein KGZ40_01045 [Clostridiales bacterium]|nr:hypothetical protein [Clostridiales bacterium]
MNQSEESGLTDRESDRASEPGSTPGSADAARRRPLFRDPFVRRAFYFTGALVTLFLVTVVSALVMGLHDPEAPRTSAERALRISELTAMQNPEDSEAWGAYLQALIASGQLTQAQNLIDQLAGVVDESGTEEVAFFQAAVHMESGRYEDAIKASEELRTRLRAYHETQKQAADTPESRGEPVHENYWQALIVIAEANVNLGNVEAAIKALDEFLEEKETAADVLIRRGYLKEQLGDLEGAETDFRAALVYMPGDPAVMEHLQRIGAE